MELRVLVPSAGAHNTLAFPELTLVPLSYGCGTMRSGMLTVHTTVDIPSGTLIPCVGTYIPRTTRVDATTPWFFPARIAPSQDWHVDGAPNDDAVDVTALPSSCAAPCASARVAALGLAYWPYMREPTPDMLNVAGYVRAVPDWSTLPHMEPWVDWICRNRSAWARIVGDAAASVPLSALPMSFVHVVDDIPARHEVVVVFNQTDAVGRRLYYATPSVLCDHVEALLLWDAAPYDAMKLLHRVLDAQLPSVRHSYTHVLSSCVRSSSSCAMIGMALRNLAAAVKLLAQNVASPTLPPLQDVGTPEAPPPLSAKRTRVEALSFGSPLPVTGTLAL